MKKKISLLSMLLGIGAFGMFLLASALNLSIGWTIGLVMLFVAVVVALVSAFLAFIEGDQGDNYYNGPRKLDRDIT